MAPPTIAITGAGPAGLTLARILHLSDIPVTIFEREPLPADAKASVGADGTQGGTLDLSEASGQLALHACGLLTAFQSRARYEGQDFALLDRHGERHLDVRDTDTGKPEIDRGVLRGLLLDSVPEGTVRWGAKALSVVDDGETGSPSLQIEEAGKIRVEGPFDLIVGAHGAWSKVRTRLSDARPVYSGVSGLDIRIPHVDAQYPELGAMVGRGSFFVFGEEERRVLLVQRNGDESIRVYAVGFGRPEGWVEDIKALSTEVVTASVLKDYKDWAPELQKLIAACSSYSSGASTTPRALYMLPLDQLSWPTSPGLTLLGDAAHLMTPFAGQGVNMAMLDALELAQKIIAVSQIDDFDMSTAVAEYEKGMFPRVQKVAKMTWDNLEARFASGGIAQMKARVERSLAAREEAAETGAGKGGSRRDTSP